MGSKTPNNDTEKQGETCDECKKEFQTIQALRSHKLAKHKSSPISTTKKEPPKKKILTDSVKPETIEKAKDIQENIPASRVSKRLQLKKDRTSDMKENLNKSVTSVKSKKEAVKSQNEAKISSIKTEFECPLCDKTFSVYFSATKHIEKKHKLTEDSTSGLIDIKPIRMERCIACSEIITDKDHMCGDDETPPSAYKCLGCQKKFSKLELFNKHTISSHGADVDYMNFRGIHGFLTWKVNMEAQIKGKYSVFDKATKEQHYQCNYVSPKNQMNMTYLCPSVIITKQLSDKFEIQYYKRHFGHTPSKYEIPDEYKKNIITKNDLESAVTDRVYKKFKTLMDSIIIDASKTNLDNLKKLLSMAITMQSCLDEDDMEITLISKSMTDNQISEELEGKTNIKTKRRAESPNNLIVKRSKGNAAFDALLSPPSKSPPSFNDSYKQFIDSTITETITDTKQNKRSAINSTITETKTNIKQNKKGAINSTITETKTDIKQNKKGAINSTVTETITNIKQNKKGAIKEVVKTKIGQFSPKKTSPKTELEKKPNVLRPSKNNSSSDIFGKMNIKDIKYEVREQENDCNILVLKI